MRLVHVIIPLTISLTISWKLLRRKLRLTQCSRWPRAVDTNTVIDLCTLDRSRVPVHLTIAHYIDIDAAEARGYEHAAYLRDTFTVVAALDGLRSYLLSCLHARVNEALATGRERLLLKDTEISGCSILGSAVVYFDDRQNSLFTPERVIGAEAFTSLIETRHALLVGVGAKVVGGCFDVSQGSIFIGSEVRG